MATQLNGSTPPADLGEFIQRPTSVRLRSGKMLSFEEDLSFGQETLVMTSVVAVIRDLLGTKAAQTLMARAVSEDEFDVKLPDVLALIAEGASSLPEHLAEIAGAIIGKDAEFVKTELTLAGVFEVVAPFLRERWRQLVQLLQGVVPQLIAAAQTEAELTT